MSDNFTFSEGAGSVGGADNIGGVFFPRVKLIHGVDGVNDGDVSSANPLPISNAALTELAAAINGSQLDVDIKASDVDLMLGTDFSGVFGSSSLVDGSGRISVKVNNESDGSMVGRFMLSDPTNTNRAEVNGSGEVSVVAAALPLPSGAATSANQSTANTALSAIQTAVETLDNIVSGSEAQVDVVAALPAGTNNIGDVDVDSIAAGSNLIGDVGIGVRTSGGTTPYKNLDVDETEDAVKASAGQVYWIHAINTTDAPLYLKFYNATVANVSVGSTTPTLTFPVPGNADSDGAGFTLTIPNGITFDTAITIAATTGVADADTGAPGANALIVNLGYN